MRPFRSREHLLVPLVLTLLSAPAIVAPAAAGETSLFPKLRVEDFPERPDTVRIEVVDAARGRLDARMFHGRRGNVGFPSLVSAVVTSDPETKRDRLDLLRRDDDCIAAAKEAGRDEREVCVSMTLTEIADGVARVVFRSRFFDFQVQLTLAQTREDPSRWVLVPTGRRGEPQRLEVRVSDDGDQVSAEWLLYHEGKKRIVELPLAAAVDAKSVKTVGFSPIQAAALSGLDLFYDLADSFLSQWVVYQDTEIVDEGIPSPGDNDPSKCELVEGVCGAEYDTCVATPSGWYGCNTTNDLGWGGKFVDDPPGGPGPVPPQPQPPEGPLPDWRIGSMTSNPPAPQPLFGGLMPMEDPSQGNCIAFELTSVLAKADTVAHDATPMPSVQGGHHVLLYVTRQYEGFPSTWACGEVHFDHRPEGTYIPVRDAMKYETSESSCVPCLNPDLPGIYILRYALDPYNMWDEGAAGEANNKGNARGYWYWRGR